MNQHEQLEELTQGHEWRYTAYVKLDKEDVLQLIEEYKNLKRANIPQPEQKAGYGNNSLDTMQSDAILSGSTQQEKEMKLSQEQLAIRRLKAKIKSNEAILKKGTLDNDWLRKFIDADVVKLRELEATLEAKKRSALCN